VVFQPPQQIGPVSTSLSVPALEAPVHRQEIFGVINEYHRGHRAA
jgi:hypothetical protein